MHTNNKSHTPPLASSRAGAFFDCDAYDRAVLKALRDTAAMVKGIDGFDEAAEEVIQTIAKGEAAIGTLANKIKFNVFGYVYNVERTFDVADYIEHFGPKVWKPLVNALKVK